MEYSVRFQVIVSNILSTNKLRSVIFNSNVNIEWRVSILVQNINFHNDQSQIRIEN